MPALLDDDLSKKIVGATMNGCSVEDVVDAYSVSRASFFRWKKRGEDAQAARDDGAAPSPADDVYIDFAQRIAAARAQAKVEAEGVIRQSILGGQSEVTEEWVYDESAEPNEAGERLRLKSRKVKTLPPNPITSMMWLERRYPQEFARMVRTEVSGPGGMPISIEERARDIAAEAEDYLRSVEENDPHPVFGPPSPADAAAES